MPPLKTVPNRSTTNMTIGPQWYPDGEFGKGSILRKLFDAMNVSYILGIHR